MKNSSMYTIAPGAGAKAFGNSFASAAPDARPVVLTVTVVLTSLIAILVSTG